VVIATLSAAVLPGLPQVLSGTDMASCKLRLTTHELIPEPVLISRAMCNILQCNFLRYKIAELVRRQLSSYYVASIETLVGWLLIG